MNAYDQLALAALVAALFLHILSIYLQKYWRFYDLFVGKKHGIIAHIALISLGWLEFVFGLVQLPRSDWRFTELPLIGFPLLVIASIVLGKYATYVGPGKWVNSDLFRGKTKPTDIRRLLLGTGLFLISLALTFGRYGYILLLTVLLLGLFLKDKLEVPRRR